jgi:uncharacterized membrane protein
MCVCIYIQHFMKWNNWNCTAQTQHAVCIVEMSLHIQVLARTAAQVIISTEHVTVTVIANMAAR